MKAYFCYRHTLLKTITLSRLVLKLGMYSWMLFVYFKVTVETFSKIRMFCAQKTCLQVSFGELQLTQISLNFKTLLQLKNQTCGSKTVCRFSIILILKEF